MKSFAVLGLGRFGENLAVSLSALGNEVLAVDKEPRLIQAISDRVTRAVVGDCVDEKVLRSIEILDFDCVVVAMSGNLEASIVITHLLKKNGVKKVVSKATNELHAEILTNVGADLIVFPERDMAEKLAENLSAAPSEWVGKTLRSMNVRGKYGINVVAVKKSGEKEITLSVDPDSAFAEDDIVVLAGENEQIKKLTK